MLPKYHILFGFLAAIILKMTTSLSNAAIGIIFLASFLTDLDHYFFYTLKKKDFSPENAYEWFIKRREKYSKLSSKQREKYKHELLIFHGIEFWLILLILSTFSNIFTYIFIGTMIHIVFDYIDMYYEKVPLYTKISQIYLCLRNAELGKK